MTPHKAPRTRPTQHEVVLGAIVDALATYRLSVLVKDDKIAEDLREAVFSRYGHLEDSDVRKPSYLMGCPWCLSIYFGVLAVAGQRYAPRLWRPLSRVLALSAATGLLAEARGAAQTQGRERSERSLLIAQPRFSSGASGHRGWHGHRTSHRDLQAGRTLRDRTGRRRSRQRERGA